MTVMPDTRHALPRTGVTWGQPDPPTEPGSGNTLKPKTRKAYAKRAAQLMKRCLKEHAETSDHATGVTDAAFVAWLIARKPQLVAPTWRLYKAAVCRTLEASIEKRTALRGRETDPVAAARIAKQIVATEHLLERLQAEGTFGCAATSEQTSATKTLGLPEVDRWTIAAALARTPSRYATALADYLLAGVRAGLRPVEWAGTCVLPDARDGALVLRVTNAKYDDTRGNGAFRILTFTGLLAEERTAILRWLDLVQAAGAGFDALMTALGDLLYVVTRRLWPRRTRHPSLYSVRHAFAASAKLCYDPAEVAALLGHASDATATRHYGRHRAGRALPPETKALLARLPRPDPDEVARVRRRIEAEWARLPELRAGSAAPSAIC